MRSVVASRRWVGLAIVAACGAVLVMISRPGAVGHLVDTVWPGRLDLPTRGEQLFAATLSPNDGLGPLFNAQGCIECHNTPTPGGSGPDGLKTVVRVGRLTGDGFDPLAGRGGPVARAHSVSELGFPCDLTPGIPAAANATSVRNAPPLFGVGLIDAIPDEVIRAGAVPRDNGVAGHPNLIRTPDGRERVGRFGWKADVPTLELFVAEAFRTELGITNPLARDANLPSRKPDGGPPCAGESDTFKDDGSMVESVTAYLAALPAPASAARAGATNDQGASLFADAGCAACHTPSLQAGEREVRLYSDLLLHQMGPSLDDGVVQFAARGGEWRTVPLWGINSRVRFLHDGRGHSIDEAIRAHAGEAEYAMRRFRALNSEAREALLAFVGSL